MTEERLTSITSPTTYIGIPCMLLGEHRNVVAFIAKGAKHFKRYGIREGSLLIFDLDKDFVPGHPSCFIAIRNKAKPKYKMSKNHIDGFEHVGSFVAAYTNWSEAQISEKEI